jgi:hypothetical protein
MDYASLKSEVEQKTAQTFYNDRLFVFKNYFISKVLVIFLSLKDIHSVTSTSTGLSVLLSL